METRTEPVDVAWGQTSHFTFSAALRGCLCVMPASRHMSRFPACLSLVCLLLSEVLVQEKVEAEDLIEALPLAGRRSWCGSVLGSRARASASASAQCGRSVSAPCWAHVPF